VLNCAHGWPLKNGLLMGVSKPMNIDIHGGFSHNDKVATFSDSSLSSIDVCTYRI
jgi:hypothetical protein